jgi:RimJ/RimL family protein N-acetyltransferase
LIDDDSLVGDCGFCPLSENRAEIGYSISPHFQRKGLGREVTEALVGFLFEEMSIHKIIARTDPENLGSIKILEGIGFRNETHLKRSVKIRGEWKDDLVYVILQDEWTNSV